MQPKVEGICDLCGGELIQRKDDNEETLKSRLNEYHKLTVPLITYYSELNVMDDVDGTKELDELFKDIQVVLGE